MWNDGGGWSDEDEDDRMPEDVESSISPPSAPSHVSKVLCMGALCKPGRFSFSASTTYICSLVGDKFYYARGEGRAGGLQNMQQQPQHQSAVLSTNMLNDYHNPGQDRPLVGR